mmetsp:Transcript_45168/g.115566  ORF Transcript_45168/g.115566 Transcript_45168/m.115566 type:complete len:103 (-) Transcript_45168:645-953(-)
MGRSAQSTKDLAAGAVAASTEVDAEASPGWSWYIQLQWLGLQHAVRGEAIFATTQVISCLKWRSAQALSYSERNDWGRRERSATSQARQVTSCEMRLEAGSR